jgi:hypothetical protein
MTNANWTKGLVPLFLSVALAACGGGSNSGDEDPVAVPWPPVLPMFPPWLEPDCDSIAGPAVATLSFDGGITMLPNDEEIPSGTEARTQSIASNPLHGGHVVAARGTAVYSSWDSGCTWESLASTSEPLRLVGQSYPWGVFGLGERGDRLYVFHGTRYAGSRDFEDFEIPFHAIDFAPARLSTLHALTQDGRIMRLEFDDSLRDADNWDLVGLTPASGNPRFIAVNPGSSYVGPAHIITTMESGPPSVTFDSGQTWATSAGILAEAESVRTGRAHFSNQTSPLGFTEMDVWIALERTRTDPESGTPIHERAIARSTDGGRTFADVVADDGEMVRIEDEHFDGRLLVTRNNAPGELWFPGGSCPDAEPRLYHYQASDDSLTIITWNAGTIQGIESLAVQEALGLSGPGRKAIKYLGHGAVGTCD